MGIGQYADIRDAQEAENRMAYEKDMDNLEEYAVGIRIRILAGQLNAATNACTWCIARDRVYSISAQEQELMEFMRLGRCLEIMRDNRDRMNRPLIITDSIGMIWIGEYVYSGQDSSMLVAVGPILPGNSSISETERMLREQVDSIQTQRQMIRAIVDIPVLPMSVITQYCKMLHFTLTSERIQSSDCTWYRDAPEQTALAEGDCRPQDEHGGDYHPERLFRGEDLFLQAVREGDPGYLKLLETIYAPVDGYGYHTGDALRDWKDTQIVFLALCCRSAIEGGLSQSGAREIENRYVTRIERCNSISEIQLQTASMLRELISGVRASRENPMVSKTIRECCDYIRMNVLLPLTAEDIAGKFGYSTYYFTKRFHHEMGMKISEYIKQTRIEYAKVVLLTTPWSMQDISELLHFGTRNYFSKEFHKVTGITPTEYRENALILQPHQED